MTWPEAAMYSVLAVGGLVWAAVAPWWDRRRARNTTPPDEGSGQWDE